VLNVQATEPLLIVLQENLLNLLQNQIRSLNKYFGDFLCLVIHRLAGSEKLPQKQVLHKLDFMKNYE